ncbi:MAG: hypothetical protein JSR55_03365 [Proteobacteria bacterium]|jgi:hypothetical protein|nr:hypothetical protein [Pseudomonadota bacterium]
MDDDDIKTHNARERRKRSIVLALVLGGLVLLFFLMTMVRMGGHVLDMP